MMLDTRSVLAFSVLLLALKVTGREVVRSPLEVLMRDRSSDPNESNVQDSSLSYDPNKLPHLPLGQPDSIEYDIPGAPLDPDDFQPKPELISHDPDPIFSQTDFDPIMLAGLFQGDILLNSEEELAKLTVLV
ncbi:hypothetical protein SK128_025251 [Halocaridina rubra]|uniref:Uncharacterized protein n=1 Tax=Halocaridina rubra TaxID=373956 RepID=A0AAN8WYJ5_HALRR